MQTIKNRKTNSKKKMDDDYFELENSIHSNDDFNIDDLPILELRHKTSSSIQVNE